MKRKKKNIVYQNLDAYLRKLDNAEIIQGGIFSSERDKERYETFFMYAVRKYKAARYHAARIRNLIKKEENLIGSILEKISKENRSPGESSRSRVSVSTSLVANFYIYELSSFLAAIRSSIDFLCSACAFHMKGVKADSLRTIVKLVNRGTTGPILDDVRENLEWLQNLRNYRDQLVHRLVIRPQGGFEIRSEGNIQKSVRYPVAIPEKTPSFVIDTRRRRMEEAEGLKFNVETKVKKNEKGRVVDFSIKITPPPGYIAVEDFSRLHLSSYEKFFSKLVRTLTQLEFQVYVYR